MSFASTAPAVSLVLLAGIAPAATPLGLGVENPAPTAGDDDHDHPQMDNRARLLEHDSSAFRAPPFWGDTFHGDNQVATYGDKWPVTTQHPLRLSGRPLYREGELGPGINLIGEKNLVFHHLLLFGDWRNAAGWSRNEADQEIGRFATRLNLDIDLGITATERIHAFIRPLDRGNEFTGFDFAGDFEGEEQFKLDGNLEALFFEGDLGAMFRGPGARSLPIAIGKMPMLFQNGVWVEDAFTGVAVSIPAKNSPRFDVANYDFTFFAAVDDVTTQAGTGARNNEDEIFLLGAATFIEAHEGFWEAGYGFVGGRDSESDIDYHNLTVAFTKRYFGRLSNSLRAIVNVGQDSDAGNRPGGGADGVLLLAENSWITSRPSTLIPYFNLFAGFGTPQSLARDAGAGGVLKNTGINFERDAQTDYPSLDATGHNAFGGAVGVEFLFDLDKQLVFEVAGQIDHGGTDDSGTAPGSELAFGTRFQLPLSNAWIFRADAMYGIREETNDIAGIRFELRFKF